MKSFRSAKWAYCLSIVFGIIAALFYFFSASARGGNGAILALVVVIALCAALLSIVFVMEFMNGCQQSLDTLNVISDQLEDILNAVNRNNGREDES